jgi:hypothetical protein
MCLRGDFRSGRRSELRMRCAVWIVVGDCVLLTLGVRYGEDKELTEGYEKDLWE